MIILKYKVIGVLFFCLLTSSLLGQEELYISTDWQQSGRLFEQEEKYSNATSWKTDPLHFVGQVGDELIYYATHYNSNEDVDVNKLSVTLNYFNPKNSSTRQISELNYPSNDEVKCLAILGIDDSLFILVANITDEKVEYWAIDHDGNLATLKDVANVKVKPTAYAKLMKIAENKDTYYIKIAPKLYYQNNCLLKVSKDEFTMSNDDKMPKVSQSGGEGSIDINFNQITYSEGSIYYLDLKVGNNLKKCHVYKFNSELESFTFLKEFMLEEDYSNYNSFQLFCDGEELLVAAFDTDRSYEKSGLMATSSNQLFLNKITLYHVRLTSGIKSVEEWFVPTYPILEEYITPRLISRNGSPFLIANVDRSYLEMAKEKPEYYKLDFENMVVCEYPITKAQIGTGNTILRLDENDAILTEGIHQISDYLLMVPKLNREKLWINFSILNPVYYE